MAITLQEAREYSENISQQLAGKEAEWRQFLKAAGNLYKYSFSDQLMTYAQRPGATATATYETWRKLGRYVKRGSKGVALFREDGTGLKYVFDVSSTETALTKNRIPALPPWKMTKAHTKTVFGTLEAEYGIQGSGLDYPSRLRKVVAAAVENMFPEIYERVTQELSGSYFERLEELGRISTLKKIVGNSAAYMVFSRMGVNPELYLDSRDFNGLERFNTPELLGVLGEAVSGVARPILRQVEREVKRIDREIEKKGLANKNSIGYNKFNTLNRERGSGDATESGIHGKRGLSVSEPDNGSAPGGHREVREHAAQIPERTPQGAAQRPAAGREAPGAPDRSQRNHQDADRSGSGGIAGAEPSPGQSGRPNGLGTAHEHVKRESGGNRDTGDGLQLSFYNALPDIPSPEEQRDQIETAGNMPAVSFSAKKPEYVLGYQYVNDCLIVRNDIDAHPDKLSPIVARVEPDGSIVILDENLPEAERAEIRRVADTELDRYKADAETRWQKMLDAANAVTQADKKQTERTAPAAPRKPARNPAPHAQKQYDLGFGHMGNGLTVWNRLEEKDGDYVTVAHISPEREVSFYEDLPEDIKARIIHEAETSNARVSATQDRPVFSAPARETQPSREELVFPGNFFDGAKPQAELPPPERTAPTAARRAPSGNFQITDDHLGEGGQKTKYGFNIAAIRTLKQIEAENRHATPEEQEILSRYVGWGGIPQAFDEKNGKWTQECAELKGLLTEPEYEAARRSTLNAHYTSPTVIKAMYETLERLGFEKGNLLEPAMGVGNFFGLLPDSMKAAKLYGVELDGITGRIAQELYPGAHIEIKGFQDTRHPDSFFDAAIGNVPFGNYGISDKRYDRHKFHIHDYFFARTLDKVRPGGVIAFVTSSYTMDKFDSSVRKYLAQRADLLGAVRLPNNAFYKNAGTEVTSDILFLQKRDRLVDLEPDWVHLGETEDGVPLNSYFAGHPEMVLGTMVFDKSMYGNEKDTSCHPVAGSDLAVQFREALARIGGRIEEYTIDDVADLEELQEVIPADPDVRNHSFTLVDGRLYFRENSVMRPVQPNATAAQRIRGLIEVRDRARRVIDLQLQGFGDSEIEAAQEDLNRVYDSYAAKFGLLNSGGNKLAFAEDSSYPLLCSLENLDNAGNLKSKADIFTKRTIKAYTPVTHVETAQEALAVSLSERACADLGYMSTLMGGGKLDEMVSELRGIIFKDPASGPDDLWTGWLTADEYLSGNVREKLARAERAAADNPMFSVNVASLREVQPKALTATEIEVKLGTTWIPQEDYSDFLRELLGVPESCHEDFNIRYLDSLNEYRLDGNSGLTAIQTALNNTYGTKCMSAMNIIKRTLNQKTVRVYDTKTDAQGKEVRVINPKETAIAQNRQEKIKRAFRDWIWQNPERRDRLCEKYNRLYNSTRPREFDGSHLTFPGMNPEIKLEQHQKDAVARILYGNNTLLAHVVGAGKTFEMIAAAMEAKRLGLAEKPMFVVPNHLTEQFGGDVLKLYPGANILVSTKKDFEPENRKKFCSRISTGNYDAVIIGHSQFERIPLSKERQIQAIKGEVAEISHAIQQLKEEKSEKYTIKQMEKMKVSLEEKIKRLTDDTRKDETVTFEQLGVDRLNVDEAHLFKNLFMFTKMQNVAGIASSAAQRSSDMYWKTGYMDEITGGKGVVFATGTPVSNSMVELYTMERYLMRGRLSELNLAHFDQWASTFGETQTAMELAPEGTGFRMKTRFSRFFNLPEVVGLFKEVADIKMADQLNLPRPKAHFHDVVTLPSEYQQDLIESLADRADMVRNREVEPNIDNMLRITTDGRKAALDQRLINPLLPDDPDSKVNACADKVFEIYEKTAAQRSAQLIFCDLSTPGDKVSEIPMKQNEDGSFTVDREKYRFRNIYEDLKVKLMEKGVKPGEIAFIHQAKTDKQKAELFEKVRSGEVRVLIGSTSKMGAGTNVQKKLIALHHLDVPWKPSDIEQQEGRILRQGNDNPEVDIFRYITKNTFDSYSWQILEGKQKFIGQIMTSKNPARSCEDMDEQALSFAEVKALATGDPRIKEKMNLDVEIVNLRTLKADYLSQRYQFEGDLAKRIPQGIQVAKNNIQRLTAAKAALDAHPVSAERFNMEIGGNVYTERKAAGAAIIQMCLADSRPEGLIGNYRGFEMRLNFDEFAQQFKLELKNSGVILSAEISEDEVGTVNRINNAAERVPELLEDNRTTLEGLQKQTETIRAELEKPFPYAEEMEQKEERMTVLMSELAEAEKEQSVKRALRKSQREQGAQASQDDTAVDGGKSITEYLQDFQSPPVSGGVKTREAVIDLARN